MNNKILVGVIAIVLVVLGGAYYASQKTDTATPNTSVSTGDSGSNVNSGSSSAGESLPPVETEVALSLRARLRSQLFLQIIGRPLCHLQNRHLCQSLPKLV